MKSKTTKELTAQEMFDAVGVFLNLHEKPTDFDHKAYAKCYDYYEGIVEERCTSKETGDLKIFLSARELTVYISNDDEPYSWDLDFIQRKWRWIGTGSKCNKQTKKVVTK